MKKIIAIAILITSFLSFLPKAEAKTQEGYFVVTAYYSPLPNQKYYLKGNYEDEKTLNGQGIAGASGKGVFSGMLAAPKKYSFGTKIYLEGLGVGVVEDRGGAIVEAGNRGYSHDRIDIWVGYGDEGLRRALYWGKRKIKGTVISTTSEVSLDYSVIPSPLWATRGLKKISNIFHTPLGVGSEEKKVSELQTVLQEVGMYHGEIDGIYNSEVIDAIYDFQVENDIMKHEYTRGAGYWGTTTRNTFFKKYISGELTRVKTDEEETMELLKVFDGPLQNKTDTKKLQEVLTKIAGYEGVIDGEYASIKGTILEYQLTKEIIPYNGSIGSGVFGPTTRKTLKEDFELYIETQARQLELEKLFQQFEEESIEEAANNIQELGTPKYGDISTNVRQLQILLREMGYFDYKDTAIFGVKTKNSIIAFQKDVDIIQTASDTGAGVFGPKTREAFEKELKNIILQNKLEEAEIFEEIELMRNKNNENVETISSLETISIKTI